MENLLNILLTAAPAQGPQTGGTQMFIMLGLIIVVFYLFMIRPQMKRQKELKNFRESLKKGDKIITTGGIYGKVSELSDNTLTIEIADKVKIKIDKAAVLRDPSDMTPQQG